MHSKYAHVFKVEHCPCLIPLPLEPSIPKMTAMVNTLMTARTPSTPPSTAARVCPTLLDSPAPDADSTSGKNHKHASTGVCIVFMRVQLYYFYIKDMNVM